MYVLFRDEHVVVKVLQHGLVDQPLLDLRKDRMEIGW